MSNNKGKKNVIFISVRRGYITNGLKDLGYEVIHPYKDKTLVGRVLREVWFRLGLPEHIWYTKVPNGFSNIIVHDPLITRSYLLWLVKRYNEAHLYFMYVNMIGKAKHLFPRQIPKGISIWTYDEYDCKKYGINLLHGGGYLTSYVGKKKMTKYDVFFVGADKGRAEYLLELQKQMEDMGLKTKFIIAPDGRFSKKKFFYSKPIPYNEVIEYVNESKAVLNITLANQMGATMRDFESVFNGVKLITNNKNIKNFDFYVEDNVFILGERELSELPKFLKTPFVTVNEKILKKNTVEAQLREMIDING